MLTLAFDVYGTLIDTGGIQTALGDALDDAELGERLSRRWRDKQLEYSFRKALMEHYQPFATCTRQALRFALAEAGRSIEPDMEDTLMDTYRHLPPFDDAKTLLAQLEDLPVRPFAFTNGEAAVATDLLSNADLLSHLEGIVSVEVIRTFKPSPRVYQHFLETTDAEPNRTWLISGNPFDILGAKAAGWRTAWVRRGDVLFDPWDQEPDAILRTLTELPGVLDL
ncbi:haloacid dehalogenase type II [Saccharospirillum salsuginis]|uniref:(S)-2-haloacid dehalogenase n=1 Tax=Saccharospirillum salsuginis TaxID=418750 RepID=A0A918NB41_9GAMM|nr:haloacid dehalogenase type II [Saccharospirillum salsuginis]GGX55384.1 haloacetate dehalogenase [Saccharospirillum salsuginis]